MHTFIGFLLLLVLSWVLPKRVCYTKDQGFLLSMSCVLHLDPFCDEQTIPLLSFLGECPPQGLGEELGNLLRLRVTAASGSWADPMCIFVNRLKFAQKPFMWLHCRWTAGIVLSSWMIRVEMWKKKKFWFLESTLKIESQQEEKKKTNLFLQGQSGIKYSGIEYRFWSQSDLIWNLDLPLASGEALDN